MNKGHIALNAGLVGFTAAAIFVPSAVMANSASAVPAQNQCDVRVHFVVDHAGNENINVTGQCAGHAPTASDMKRLAQPLVLPQWANARPATKREIRRLHLHGPCEIYTMHGHPGFTIECRNGQYRLLP